MRKAVLILLITTLPVHGQQGAGSDKSGQTRAPIQPADLDRLQRMPPAQIRMPATDNQREFLAEYLAFVEEGADFARGWASWKRAHDQLVRSVSYDYQLFRIETKRWHKLQTNMVNARLQRAGKRCVEND